MKVTLLVTFLPLAVTALPTDLVANAKRQLFGSSAVKCGPVAVLFSRGTFEPGTYGITTGSAFTTALQAALPSGTQFWGNEYNNDVFGYLTGGSASGTVAMKNRAQAYVDACPNIKLVMGGYSQGAQVTHKALETSNTKVKNHVAAVVFFGDPMAGRAIPGIPKDRIQTVCAVGDGICTGLPLVTVTHLVYTGNAASSAAWVKGKVSSFATPGGDSEEKPKSSTPKTTKGKGSSD